LERAAEMRRIVVLGPTDAGKSTFIHALALEREAQLIDLDPGQKMIGPPGTATLGRIRSDRLEKMIFLGTTSASALGAIARAGAALAAAAEGRFIVNTAGFVRGLGARLQALTVAAIAPDLIVEIGGDAAALPIVRVEGVRLIRLERSELAGRKSPAVRASIRQAAFETALSTASPLRLQVRELDPGLPAFEAMPGALPVCALADANGEDMAIGILQDLEEEAALVHAAMPDREVVRIRLGKMWAAPDGEGGWRLIEKLIQAWQG
jgi:polynucleotide 5'-hydroxyl-kinase GRC3/NOL9